jgi:hypothetical protein
MTSRKYATNSALPSRPPQKTHHNVIDFAGKNVAHGQWAGWADGFDKIHKPVVAGQFRLVDPKTGKMLGHAFGNEALAIIFNTGVGRRDNHANTAA